MTGNDKSAHNLSLAKMLDDLGHHAGDHDPVVGATRRSLVDELACHMSRNDYPYDGIGEPWDVVTGSVTHGSFADNKAIGFLTERKTFRPFFLGLLTEGAARQADRWFVVNHGMEGHTWEEGIVETEVYRGIRNILLRPRYHRCVHRGNIDELVVIISTIALLAPHPDWAVMKMLGAIERERCWMPINEWDKVLRRLMADEGELGERFFRDTMESILHGPSLAIARSEFVPVYEQLKVIYSASIAALRNSFALFDRSLNWKGLWQTVIRYNVPTVRVSDGIVSGFNGAECNMALHDLILNVHRKVFPTP